jgi:predicted Zn finger-like uncharacterized protein
MNRVVFCPSCGARYDVAADIVAPVGLVLLCGSCGHASAMGVFTAEVQRTESDVARALEEAHHPRVVVGHEVPAASRSIAHALRQHGYAPVCVKTGEQVLSACDPAMPAPPVAVVLDVAISGVLAFEVIEQLRAQPATRELPVVLLASVFERTRYKRRPTNLYGADAYLELHHVPDRLATIVETLRGKNAVPPERLQAPVERARAASLRGRPVADDVETARALARRLLSDVALYHGDELAEGVRRGDPFGALAAAVDAARDMHRGAASSLGASGTAGVEGIGQRAEQVFDEELRRFAAHLLERERREPGAPSRSADG